MIRGSQNRGGSSGRGFKLTKPQKITTNVPKKTTKQVSEMKRDGRHVSHPTKHSGDKLNYTHLDINTVHQGVKTTRSISLRGGH